LILRLKDIRQSRIFDGFYGIPGQRLIIILYIIEASISLKTCVHCTVGDFNFELFLNFSEIQTEIDRYWQTYKFLLFASLVSKNS
jgi:hypothetical protein